jgi:hypothetical protein
MSKRVHRIVWRALADKLVVIDADGGYVGALREPFVQSLATDLTSLLDGPASGCAPVGQGEMP